MVLEEGSDGQTDILHEVQVTYQKKQSEDTLRIRDHQTASKEHIRCSKHTITVSSYRKWY